MINKISNKKEKDHRNSISCSDDGGFNLELSLKIKMRKNYILCTYYCYIYATQIKRISICVIFCVTKIVFFAFALHFALHFALQKTVFLAFALHLRLELKIIIY